MLELRATHLALAEACAAAAACVVVGASAESVDSVSAHALLLDDAARASISYNPLSARALQLQQKASSSAARARRQ